MHPQDQTLTPETLLRAYAAGIFPMAEAADSSEIFWVDPRRRGVFPLEAFHISRSLARRIRSGTFDVALDQAFIATVTGCADRSETWINGTIFDLYRALAAMGHAHSLEVYQNGSLAGGVYGVTLGSAFFGESMFSRHKDASKVALAYLTCHLRRTGFTLFDTQFLTPHLASLGAIEIPRPDYHNRLQRALMRQGNISARPLPSAQDVLQRRTQKS
ncbi:MAG: leucyl/phenylalanyl-tRNA--protein transferase [Pseudomonadota bacterium]